MLTQGEYERFAAELREVTRSLAKKRFWSLLRESIAAHTTDAAKKLSMLRTAADHVAHISEPSPRIELNGHSASSLLRAIAEVGNVPPHAFEGIKGKGPEDSLIHISPFDPREALFAFAWKRGEEDATFVHGYFDRSAHELLEWTQWRHGKESPHHHEMAKYVLNAQAAKPEGSLPPLADAILSRLRLSPLG